MIQHDPSPVVLLPNQNAMPPLKRLVRFTFLLLFAVLVFNVLGFFFINRLSEQNRLSEEGENNAASQQIYMQQIVGKISALSIHHHFSQEQFANQMHYLATAAAGFRRGQGELSLTTTRLEALGVAGFKPLHDSTDAAFHYINGQAEGLLHESQGNRTDALDPGRLHASAATYLGQMNRLHDRFRALEHRTETRIETLNQALIISMVACLLYLAVLVVAPIFRQSTRNYEELQRSLEEVRRTKDLLHQSERKYRDLFERSPLPMWIFDSETLRFLEVNQMAVKHYGYTAEEFSAMTILDIRAEAERGRLQDVKQHPRAEGVNAQGLWTHIKKDGQAIFVEISSHRIDYNGRSAMLILAKDVTRNIELQDALLDEKIAHQRDIARASITVQEKERNEIGRELHDNVNQILTSVKLHLEYMGNNGADTEKHRSISLNMVANVIQEIRRLSRSLVPPTLDDVGLIPSIADLAESINSLGGMQVLFGHEAFEEDVLPPGLKLAVLRIIQEQTTNILKYAQASEARIELRQQGSMLYLRISDNGVGFDPQQVRRGIGLTNITNRADIYHGALQLRALPGEGCVLEVRFDLDKVLELDPRVAAAQAE
ncbi:MAG: PAS domain-containing sensor histidine kinase [Chitinophagaceae bacterium]|nr:MAG: PAS domain-containing sensor histidine kinase [Chitinophagaceae bacterium]